MSNEYNIEETYSDESENNIVSDSEEESSVPSLSSASHIGPYQFEPYNNNNNNSSTQATENTVSASPDNNTNDQQSRAGTIDWCRC